MDDLAISEDYYIPPKRRLYSKQWMEKHCGRKINELEEIAILKEVDKAVKEMYFESDVAFCYADDGYLESIDFKFKGEK